MLPEQVCAPGLLELPAALREHDWLAVGSGLVSRSWRHGDGVLLVASRAGSSRRRGEIIDRERFEAAIIGRSWYGAEVISPASGEGAFVVRADPGG